MALPAAAAAVAAPPALPAPPVLPATLADWFSASADPHGDTAQLLHPFGDAPNVVDAICTSLTTTTCPLPLLANGTDGRPHAILMPFN